MKDKKNSVEVTEEVRNIPLSELHPFKDHPFKVRDDEAMAETMESVKEYGVLMPAIARPLETGGYELISGHRRHRACELAELSHMPVIVRNVDDDKATIIMVDSNLQRENILPSERAFAYKMKLEAIKKQGNRTDLTSTQIGQKLENGKTSIEMIAENAGTSKNQVQRYISLTKLDPKILDMVDNKQMGFTPAVEISSLTQEEQIDFLDVLDAEQSIPSLSQAQRIKALSKDGNCNFDTMSAIMSEEKKSEIGKISFSTDTIKKYFPKSYTPEKMQEAIMKLLENHLKNKKKQQER
ncbi:MAG: ParB/RepB/Spo0J family partition protein [Eubacteriales bacterium]